MKTWKTILLLALMTQMFISQIPAAEPEKWNVEKTPDPYDMADLDTDEGSWMSLDVSPDGEHIVFDLLGDLYEIPIAGGEATALTSGTAWDIQPCYSPDGKHIAYTSDRAGGDNIWTMNRDGSERKQVTKESYRLLNSPAWTPDSQYIAARKHFTSTRSMGAGEIWLYHTSGGDGLMMTKRPNDQKDLGEPAFSPDGRYLYFSQDVTPGSEFEYDKDSNTGIYAIRRLDREKGEIDTIISGPGGAIRPTPSPDGKLIAFIKRVRFQSVLYLHEIKTGAEWPIYDNLDRDLQESWAIHGVYPHIAWMPDSRSMVVWAKGKIWRIDAQTKEVANIPFRATGQRKLTRAVRNTVPVAPEKFHVKMLRWPQVSPDGKQVVFQTLGKLYLRNLPDGKPRRLTRETESDELYPSWSRDGNSITYVTWNDDKLGSVRIATVKNGKSRIVTKEPGHYIEPVFAPNGKQIVYSKISNDALRAPVWKQDTGIYVISFPKGKPKRITESGSSPQFADSSDRLFLTGRSNDGQNALISMDMSGNEKRTHFTSENATEFSVSPDGKWVAFRERYNAYIAPFVHTGREVLIGPKTTAIPIKKVSRDSGLFLHWSGDASRLHWTHGPQLFSCDLTDAFAFLDGAPEKLPETPTKGIDIGFEVDSDVPSGTLALVGARIITMQDDQVIENGTIIVEGNKIQSLGPKNKISVPDQAHVIDASGLTIMPGIVDAHAHGSYGGSGILPQRNWQQYANLAFGVTTNHDPSNNTEMVFAAAEMQKAGLLTMPRLFSTGRILYGATGWFRAEIDSLDDALSHVRRLKAVGAISVKSYNQPRREQRQQVVAACRQLGMLDIPEGGSVFHQNMTMIADGHTGIEHTLPVGNIYKDVLQFWTASNVPITPTLIVAYGGLSGEIYWYQHTNLWENERLLTYVPRTVIDPKSRRRLMAPEEEYNHILTSRMYKKLVDAGGRVQLGAHGQMHGMGPHWELWMLEQGGMTPMQALRAATLDGARYLGMDAEIGSIEKGKLADLVILEHNPLDNIRNSEFIRYVVLNGRIYDAATMNQIGNHPDTRAPFYWEMDFRSNKEEKK